MMQTPLHSMSLIVCLASAPAAATVTGFVGDRTFNTTCSLCTPNPQECEKALAEFCGIRPSTYEQSLNTPTQFGAVQAEFAWVKGTA